MGLIKIKDKLIQKLNKIETSLLVKIILLLGITHLSLLFFRPVH